MSKKSNAFQKAIMFIHQELKETNAKVIESAELRETNIDQTVKREIDVLIEKEEAGRIFRIAIECRDRAIKDDIIWVDSLIGKFKHLSVNKIIAVSSSGFSKAAKLKACANKIELREISEINKFDWKSEFHKLGFCSFKVNFNIKKIIVETISNIQISVSPLYEILSGNEKSTFQDFIEYLKEIGWSKRLSEKFKKNIVTLYKVKADLSKMAWVEHRIPVSNFQIIYNGKKHEMSAVKICLLAIPDVRDVEVKHFRYEESLLARAVFNLKDIEKKFLIFATQAKPDDGKMNISWDRKNIKKKR